MTTPEAQPSGSVLTYCPQDPTIVVAVERLRLYASPPPYAGITPVHESVPSSIVGSCVTFTIPPTLTGTFYASVTVDYVDTGPAEVDLNDVVVLSGDGSAGSGPPPWPWAPLQELEGQVDLALLERCKTITRDVLWRASGRRFGLKRMTLRPCNESCRTATYEMSQVRLSPTIVNGQWVNCGSCGCGGRECRCCSAGTREVRLPGPVQHVERVVVDSVALPSSAYEVHDHQLLVRVDGNPWPVCQDMSSPAGSPGTWSVTYAYGLPLSPAGIYAYGLYAQELYKGATGGRCRLPARVEGIFRQGINIDLADDNLDLLSKGRTGIPEVDTWLATVNPRALSESSRVYSPDLHRGRVRTA